MSRIGAIDRDVGLDARGPVAEDDDAVGEEQRLFDVMRDQQRCKPLALPERDECHRGEGVTVHQCGAARGQEPFVLVGKSLIEQTADDQADDGVTKELEALTRF